MTPTLSIACQCGCLTADIKVNRRPLPYRLVCYCTDCQQFARHLGQAEQVLDAHNGTDILQLSPASFSIRKGEQHLGMLRLSPGGIFRWYATCCNTPIGNTPQRASLPYLGLVTACIKTKKKTDAHRTATLNRLLGPTQRGICAGGNDSINASWPVSNGVGAQFMFSTVMKILQWRLRADHKNNEFFVGSEPRVEPYVLSLEEREATNKLAIRGKD